MAMKEAGASVLRWLGFGPLPITGRCHLTELPTEIQAIIYHHARDDPSTRAILRATANLRLVCSTVLAVVDDPHLMGFRTSPRRRGDDRVADHNASVLHGGDNRYEGVQRGRGGTTGGHRAREGVLFDLCAAWIRHR